MKEKKMLRNVFITIVTVMIIVAFGLVNSNAEDCEKGPTPLEILNGEVGMQLSNMAFVTESELNIYLYSGINIADVVRLDKDIRRTEAITNVRDARIMLNSGGGVAFAGLAIRDIIKNAQNRGWKVSVEANGIVASAAVPIIAVCRPRIANAGTMFMVHEAAMFKWPGRETASDIDAQQRMFALLRDRYIGYLVEDSNLSYDELRSMEKQTTWFTAKEAKEFGIVDIVQ